MKLLAQHSIRRIALGAAFILGSLLRVGGRVAAQDLVRGSTEATATGAAERVVVTGTDIPLEQSVAVGSRLGVPAKYVPASTFTVDADTIRERGFRTTEEAVESVVGFTGANSPGNGVLFSTRGFTGNDITQLFDGVRILGQSAFFSRQVDSFNYERIEVIKGPASVLHGDGAVGAAINFVSKQPTLDHFTAEGLLSYGSFNTVRVGVGLGGPIWRQGGGTATASAASSAGSSKDGKETASQNAAAPLLGVSYRVDFSHESTDGFVDRTGSATDQLTAALRWDALPTLAFTLSADAFRDDINPYWGTPLDQRTANLDRRIRYENYNVSDNFENSRSLWLRLRGEWQPLPWLSLTNVTYGYLARRKWLNAEGYAYDQPDRTVLIRDLGELAHEQSLSGNRTEALAVNQVFGHENRLLLGVDASRNDFFRSATFPGGARLVDPFDPDVGPYRANTQDPVNPGTDTRQDDLALFAEDEFRLLPSLRISGAVRADFLDVEVGNRADGSSFGHDYSPVTWRAGLVYEPAHDLTFYVQSATAIDPPRAYVLNAQPFSFGLERSRQYEGGIKFVGWEGRVQTTFAAFDIVKDRDRTFLTPDSVRIGVPDGQTHSQGVEYDGRAEPLRGWTIEGNFSLLGVEIEGGVNPGHVPANVPRQLATLFSSYRFPFGVELGGELRYVGARPGDDENTFRLKSYETLDLFARYHHANWELTVRGRNVTDRFYAQFAQTDYGRQVLLGAPASVEGTLTVRF